jgi:hypothetical protein
MRETYRILRPSHPTGIARNLLGERQPAAGSQTPVAKMRHGAPDMVHFAAFIFSG